uniref:OVARIAN TUMOR DOMAIN-containing deubiquitinating enzyme 10-like n=1 Tax=Erigeron canadensis TaxID=72917 RepID=UPI001CB90269|nr:OVARIAN TUMOR DOMAIN-containing deubiquitinating enzyme 10-like [Erigeron canadensis]
MWDSSTSDGKWGLSLYDIEQFFSYGYYGDYGYQYHTNHDYNQQHAYNASCYQEDQYPGVNNEILVSLQNGISELSIADENQSSHAAAEEHQQDLYLVEHLQVPTDAEPDHPQVSSPVGQLETFTTNQDWNYGPSSLNYHYGSEGNERIKIDRPTTPCYIPENQSCNGKETFLEITDALEFNGEVRNRLHKVNPVSLISPKINGDIPSVDEVSSDHQRLQDRLDLHGLVESKVEGDGNCQFRALSEQLYHTPEDHKFVRDRVVMQLKIHQNMYEEYIPMPYPEYLKRISMIGEWGDHVTLQAAADSYGVKILVLTSFKDTIFIEILPKVLKSKRVIMLSYWAEVHYNSMYPKGEMPSSKNEKKKESKKKWWKFSMPQSCLY